MANLVILSGRIVSPPFFDFVGEEKQAYMRMYVAVPNDGRSGPRESHVRCVAYGTLAQSMYPALAADTHIVVEGHLQVRLDNKSARWVTEVVSHRITVLEHGRGD